MTLNELTIVLNGEIYNYAEIKKELITLGHNFVSTSDTEVVLHAYKEWGKKCVDRFIGMFSFAMLDIKTNEIVIFRDRAGVKPLYYYHKDKVFMFSSELKSFYKHPDFLKVINYSSVDIYMRFGYIPSPYSIFKDCYKLEPGKYIKLDINSNKIEVVKYWNIFECYKKPVLKIDYKEAKIELKKLMLSAFTYRMISDVPVGVFLSGGYDSTLVSSILQNNMTGRLRTFTIGLYQGNNEAPAAKEIANSLGTLHTEYYCTEKEAQQIIPSLPFYYDEPFSDSSAIPTILVSKIARQDVTVALSADGGDEIFAGYDGYGQFLKKLELIRNIPNIAKPFVGKIADLSGYYIPRNMQQLKRRLILLGIILNNNQNRTRELVYGGHHKYFADFFDGPMYRNQGRDILSLQTVFDEKIEIDDDLSLSLAIDFYMNLQNDMLTKVDRATMSVSLEGREPMLDHRIVEFAAQLPSTFKFDGITSKKIIKDIVHDYLPKDLMDRPKTGFTIPISKWLKGELKFYVDEYLSRPVVNEIGIFNSYYIDYIKKLFFSDKLHDVVILWRILQFQMWAKMWYKI